ncbi:MAG: DNA polymerase III subunit gamma/tau [Planctomycetota bacterium]
MTTRALARNFRPQTFSDVIGQEHITDALVNAIKNNRVAQAYIFAGPRGCGKTTIARILAKALNCVTGITTEPCNVCEHCLSIARGDDIDVREIDGASNNGVDHIRDLRESVSHSPLRMRFRVIYIDEVHMLTTNAFNALLKTLEEPPAHVKSIFSTTEPEKIPAAVVSRCQIHYVKLVTATGIVNRLKRICESEGAAIDDDALYSIARAARGGMRDSETLLELLIGLKAGIGTITSDDVSRVTGHITDAKLAALIDSLQSGDAGGALVIVDGLFNSGTNARHLLDSLAGYLRALMLIAAGAGDTSALVIWGQHIDVLKTQAAKWSLETILAAQKLIDSISNTDLRNAPLPTLPVETALVTMSRLGSLTDISRLIKRLEAGMPLITTASPAPAGSSAPRPQVSSSPSVALPSKPLTTAYHQEASSDSSRRQPAPVATPAPATPAAPVVVSAEDNEVLEAIRNADLRGSVRQVVKAACAARRTGDSVELFFPLSEEIQYRNAQQGNPAHRSLTAAIKTLFGQSVSLKLVLGAEISTAPDAGPDSKKKKPDLNETAVLPRPPARSSSSARHTPQPSPEPVSTEPDPWRAETDKADSSRRMSLFADLHDYAVATDPVVKQVAEAFDARVINIQRPKKIENPDIVEPDTAVEPDASDPDHAQDSDDDAQPTADETDNDSN